MLKEYMDNNQSKLDAKLNARPRVAYTTPWLTVYGEVQHLTATGSGMYGENPAECNFPTPGQNGPNCFNNPMA